MFLAKRPPAPDAKVLLKVDGLSVPGWVRDLSFEVRAGEILGFGGPSEHLNGSLVPNERSLHEI